MVKEEPVHKELNPLQLVQDYKFQKQYLSLDRYYGSFVQGSKLYDLEAKADPEENNTNVSEESESLKQFQTPIGNKNPVSRYTFCLFANIETHVNEFKGLLQWDALVSYYILFSINEVYCEILESDFLDDKIRKKMKEEIYLKIKETYGLRGSEYGKYLCLTLEIPTVKDSEIAELSKEFVKEFLDEILFMEKDTLGDEKKAEPGSLVVLPDVDSLNSYLDAWKISFKALAVSIKKHFGTGNSLEFDQSLNFCNRMFNDLGRDILLPSEYEWDELGNYIPEALKDKLDARSSEDSHYWRNDDYVYIFDEDIFDKNRYGDVITPRIPEEVIQIAGEFK